MVKKSFDQEDKKPFDYFSERKTTEKQDASSTDHLVSMLRTDMLPGSRVTPSRKKIIHQINIPLVAGILIGVIILGLIWYMLLGPGRLRLEQKLVSLVQNEVALTQYVKPSPLIATEKTPEINRTPVRSPTVQPSNTHSIVSIASPSLIATTHAPTNIASSTVVPTETVTASSECRSVLSITLADVGKTLCVQGVVIETIAFPTYFMVIFSYERGAFYWVSYDLVWSQGEVDKCYQIHGSINRIANSPILIFNYGNLPEVCP